MSAAAAASAAARPAAAAAAAASASSSTASATAATASSATAAAATSAPSSRVIRIIWKGADISHPVTGTARSLRHLVTAFDAVPTRRPAKNGFEYLRLDDEQELDKLEFYGEECLVYVLQEESNPGWHLEARVVNSIKQLTVQRRGESIQLPVNRFTKIGKVRELIGEKWTQAKKHDLQLKLLAPGATDGQLLEDDEQTLESCDCTQGCAIKVEDIPPLEVDMPDPLSPGSLTVHLKKYPMGLSENAVEVLFMPSVAAQGWSRVHYRVLSTRCQGNSSSMDLDIELDAQHKFHPGSRLLMKEVATGARFEFTMEANPVRIQLRTGQKTVSNCLLQRADPQGDFKAELITLIEEKLELKSTKITSLYALASRTPITESWHVSQLSEGAIVVVAHL